MYDKHNSSLYFIYKNKHSVSTQYKAGLSRIPTSQGDNTKSDPFPSVDFLLPASDNPFIFRITHPSLSLVIPLFIIPTLVISIVKLFLLIPHSHLLLLEFFCYCFFFGTFFFFCSRLFLLCGNGNVEGGVWATVRVNCILSSSINQIMRPLFSRLCSFFDEIILLRGLCCLYFYSISDSSFSFFIVSLFYLFMGGFCVVKIFGHVCTKRIRKIFTLFLMFFSYTIIQSNGLCIKYSFL